MIFALHSASPGIHRAKMRRTNNKHTAFSIIDAQICILLTCFHHTHYMVFYLFLFFFFVSSLMRTTLQLPNYMLIQFDFEALSDWLNEIWWCDVVAMMLIIVLSKTAALRRSRIIKHANILLNYKNETTQKPTCVCTHTKTAYTHI